MDPPHFPLRCGIVIHALDQSADLTAELNAMGESTSPNRLTAPRATASRGSMSARNLGRSTRVTCGLRGTTTCITSYA